MNTRNAGPSRRDFLKLSGLGFLGLFLPGWPLNSFFQDVFEVLQGRVTARWIWVYDQPSFSGHRLKMHWRDAVVPISNVTVNDDVSAYNRVWYEITDQGYAYSGTLQPVQTILNVPTKDIPYEGALGEVSVPYTDAHKQPSEDSPVAYRMYYETVHWITAARTNPADGKIWYQVLDDKFNKQYCAPGEHLRLLSDDELAPLSPDVPDAQKKIQVRLDDQLVFAYENDEPVFVTRASTGDVYRYGVYTTPVGTFITNYKRPTRHMANGDLTSNGFDLPGVPWVIYLSEETGLSLHGTFWHNDFGHPHSHGCVNLSPSAAKWLFRWTNPVARPNQQFAYKKTGTLVEIVK